MALEPYSPINTRVAFESGNSFPSWTGLDVGQRHGFGTADTAMSEMVILLEAFLKPWLEPGTQTMTDHHIPSS